MSKLIAYHALCDAPLGQPVPVIDELHPSAQDAADALLRRVVRPANADGRLQQRRWRPLWGMFNDAMEFLDRTVMLNRYLYEHDDVWQMERMGVTLRIARVEAEFEDRKPHGGAQLEENDNGNLREVPR